MALTIYPYPMPNGTPQQIPALSSAFLIPAGTNDVFVYAIAPAELWGLNEFSIAYTMEVSTDNGQTWFAARTARIDPDRGGGLVPGHGDGLPPGEIPTGLQNFSWVPNDSAFLAINEQIRRAPGSLEFVRLDTGTVYARLVITPLEGNSISPNVMVAGVAECKDIDGNVIPIDPATLR